MSNSPQTTHRSLTGIVTKLVGDGATYGFINDEIFFPQTNVVSGGPASVGDQVFAECEYSAHLPIKWNATSVKILNKGSGLGQPGTDRAQQEMNQQQQQGPPFQARPPIAVTYQQHRQQRQQNQMIDVDHRPQNESKIDPPTRLLDQNQVDPFGPLGMGGPTGFPPQHQQQETIMGPFQTPALDGPNFTFTSQPGSAFVQNQFLPPPFLPQQPPPLLPQTQHLLPQNNQSPNNQNQRNNSNSNKAGNRFNNMDKNDRQQQNRNRNQNRNNDNKFDRMRSNDRNESPADRSRGNNRGSRDRSVGRGGKKDTPSRPSPPPQSSARSTTSSDRATKSSRRHYEPQNIPKTKIMTNMNAYNMKQRCPSSVHVPSDLKDIIVNKHFRLDIKNTPKPLRYIIEEVESNKGAVVKDEVSKVDTAEVKIDTDQKDDKQTDNSEVTKHDDGSEKSDAKAQEQPTPPSSKSDIRLNHKYGVKVILMSLPEFDSIYRTVFGQDLDSYSSDSKSRSRLDEAISLLCTKGSNNGHSLIGGKFDPVLDGFVEGKNNRFERHGRHPDLIATCKRVVHEQTGLDLGPCRGWSLLSTFIYNNKSDYFSSKASIEYSYIYMPQIWTMLKEGLGTKVSIPAEVEPPKDENDSIAPEEKKELDSSDTQMDISQDEPVKTEDQHAEEKQEEDLGELESQDEKITLMPATQESSLTTPSSSFDTSNIYEMKRDDLKLELDKRNIEYKPSAKKADLLALLEEGMNKEKEKSSAAPEATDGVPAQDQADDGPQLEEGEVVENDPSEDSEGEQESDLKQESETTKRKADDGVESESKRICTDDGSKITTSKDQRVELISEAFFVKSREEQQLTLVSLYEASQVSRHDQFELSVASNILKESLIQHLSEYILTTLVEDNRQSLASSTSSSHTSQEPGVGGGNTAGSDSNNNASKAAPTSKSQSDAKLSTKEYPIDRYINLAFSYFDSTHMGYVYLDDLNKLFNNTDLTISKRALTSLIGDNDKFNYRTLADLSPKLPATYVYEFPEQFKLLPDNSGPSKSDGGLAESATKMIEYKGVVYDIEKLTQEVKEAETMRVSMVDRFNYAIENSDKQAEEIHVLEVSQKSLSKAIKSQNDEICDLKRERDSIKKKYEALRKGIKGSIGSLSDLIKEEK